MENKWDKSKKDTKKTISDGTLPNRDNFIIKIWQKGVPFGSMQCSVQIDNIGCDSLAEDFDPFECKGEVEIPALGYVRQY